MSGAQPLVELVQSAVDGLHYRRVVTEHQEAVLVRHCILEDCEENRNRRKCIYAAQN